MTTKRFLLMLLVMLVSVTGAYAQMSFIKDVKVRVGAKGNYSELTSEGYTVISGSGETYFDFNGGGTGGDYVYIGYKTTTNPNEAISDLAIVYNNSGTSTAYGSDDFLYGGSKTMMIGNKRYYLAPHSGGPDMNNRNDKHNNCVYLYYTRDVDTSDGMRLLTTLGGNRWGSRQTTVPSGWDSMIRGYMGNGQPTTTGGSTYEVTYDAERVFGDTNEAGGGDYTYILCNYVSGIYYVDIARKAKLPNAVTEITSTSSTLNSGWYVVRGQNVQTGTLTCNGAVNIILADGAKLTATGQANNAGIQVSAAGSSLAIYGQTAQSGQLTAIGGTGASAIDGGSPGTSSPIYVNTSLTVCADDNNPPTTFVDYTIGEDVSGSLSGKRYVTMRIPKNITVTLDRQGGTGGATQVTAKEGSAMPTISVPTRTGYTFHGYYASKNGTGTKYYNADGTSAHKWDHTSAATLYAHWTVNQYTVTLDMQGGDEGTTSVIATYDDAMPEITIPTREGCEFLGYFSQPNGAGTKYYNANGTSAHVWNVANNTTPLYAKWEVVRAWYIDADGTKKSVTDFTTITNKSETTTLSSGWYIVYEADVRTKTLVCEGAVHLILLDGAKLTATGDFKDAGIRVSAEGASLTIYGQQNQTGQLIAIGGYNGSGIGGGNERSGHNITINGGIITTTGGYRSAGIGGGCWSFGENITINRGVITATGGEYGEGIGGDGYSGGSGSSNIFVNSSLVLYADGNNPPATIIRHATDEDVSGLLSGKQYAIVRIPVKGITITFDKQDGTGGDDQTTANENEDMPQINVPTRNGYAFQGYYAEPNGTGVKYYNADGTSAYLWDHTESATLYAYWKVPVSYIDADGTEKYAGVYEEITNSTTTLAEGWYIVRGADVKTHTLVCEGAVHLILVDGAKLTATGGHFDAGIRVSAEGASLTIYGQKDQNGQLIATGDCYGAGIGGANQGSGHDITINGGVITANGGSKGSGIGGGNFGTGHDITINGGVITAVGGTDASAIGAGDRGSSSNIFINSSLILWADGSNPPTTIITHLPDEDVSSSLNGRTYAIVRNPAKGVTITFEKQSGTGGTNQITVDEGSVMPDISVPERDGYAFVGYFSGSDGTGTKYYKCDGTSDQLWNQGENVTLYAYWTSPVPYIDADGTTKYAGIDKEITNETTTLRSGWYLVNDPDVQTRTLVCEGDVHLILADGAKLKATGDAWDAGIRVSAEGASLTIYGQTNQTGQLIANGNTYASGIGGPDEGKGHDITINGGMIIASGGYGASVSAIGSGNGGVASSNIFVNSSLILYADGNNPPATIIRHATDTDVSSSLLAKHYAIVRIPAKGITVTFDKQDGIGGDDQTTVDEGSDMPKIKAPTRDGYSFRGYFIGQGGSGVKYYNIDGTGTMPCAFHENTTLYAYWIPNCVVTLDLQGGSGGTPQITAIYETPMPTITVPTRDGYVFQGYYTGQNGTGTKYYNADGSSAHLWDLIENNFTLYACWKAPTAYVDADGTTKYVSLYETITNATTTLTEGWFVVSGDDVRTQTLVCEGAVHLILMDGAKLTAIGDYRDAGIRVSAEGASLTIYGQAAQTGQLIATGGYFGAGIGGQELTDGHHITINGGVITATGGSYSAGIGGGDVGAGHDITINGGVITATGGSYSAGIGGGDVGAGHDITINGGVITATGAVAAAGIGGGQYGSGQGITINGGVITATSRDGGASAIGKGSGRNGSFSDIFVNASLILKADGNATPTTEIEHTSTVDLASTLSGKQYATLALPTVTVNHASDMAANFGTFYHAYAAYTVPNEDATIYTASVETVNNETCLVLHKVEGNVIPANTAVILRTDESTVIDLQPCADASGISVPANNLSGANLPIDAPDNCYIMSYGQNGFGFYKYPVGKTLSAHKAYLVYQHPAGAQARALRMVFDDDEVNGIENINDNPSTDSGQAQTIYNLNGIRLNKFQKGINIVNGKKIIVK